jgi:hypothetical protein
MVIYWMEWNCNTYEWCVTCSKKTQILWDMTPSRLLLHTNNDTNMYIYIYIYLFIIHPFNSIKYIPHWRSLREMEVNHICCGISKFSDHTLYSLQVRPANYRLQINSVFVHRKRLRLLLIENPRLTAKYPFLLSSYLSSQDFHLFQNSTTYWRLNIKTSNNLLIQMSALRKRYGIFIIISLFVNHFMHERTTKQLEDYKQYRCLILQPVAFTPEFNN